MVIKKLLIATSITLAFLAVPLSASAGDDHKPDLDKLRGRIDAIRANIKNSSDSALFRNWDNDGKFKEEIMKIKDRRKQQTLENIETKLASMAARRQEQLTRAHDQLETIYNKLVTKQQTLKTAGNDTASAEAALSDAKIALDNAQASITSGSAIPTPDLSNQDTLKQTVKDYLKQIDSNFKQTTKLLIEAREDLRKASRSLIKIENMQKGATGGPTPTSTI